MKRLNTTYVPRGMPSPPPDIDIPGGWLALSQKLASPIKRSDPGDTIEEIAADMRCGTKTARKIINKLIEQGLVTKGRRWKPCNNGIGGGNWMVVYQRVEPKAKKGVEK